jgi:chorismate mutase
MSELLTSKAVGLAPKIRAVRGATTVLVDTPVAIEEAVGALLFKLVALNAIEPEAIVSVFFTVTDDLHSVSVAKVARTVLPWPLVSLMCSLEPKVDGLPERCVRVMIQFYTPRQQGELVPVYLGDAAALRPDRVLVRDAEREERVCDDNKQK